MRKKLGFVAIVIIVAAAGICFWQRSSNAYQDTSQPKEAAIKQAQEYQSKGVCTQSLVPAVHKATGARYTFRNGCLAPGWESER